jgi:hypothetical protein
LIESIGGNLLNEGLTLDRIGCARNAGIFILLRLLFGFLIFLSLGTIFYVPAEAMLPAIQIVKTNLLFFILIILALIPMAFLSLVISFPLNNVLTTVDKVPSLIASRLRVIDALVFITSMILLIAEIPFFYQVFLIGLIFYAVHLMIVGYLVYKSGFLPRLLGIFLILGGVFGYIFASLTGLVAPDLIWVSTIGVEIAINVEIALALILIHTARTTTFDDDDSKSRVIRILENLGEATTTEIIAEASKESVECKDRVPRTLVTLERNNQVMKRLSKEKKGYVWTLT